MCTIIALFGARADYPLVLATNRDEFYARPTGGPARLFDAPPAVGGVDKQAGGTWMGVTSEGLFVGITNQRTFTPPDRGKRSRGELVMKALSLREPRAVRAWLADVDARDYNAFNLMFGSARELYAAYGRERDRAIEIEAVRRGLHVLPNDRLDSPDFLKVARAKALLDPVVERPFPELIEALKSTLADAHLPPPEALPDPPPGAPFDKPMLQRLAALCVTTPVYGTRSSTIVALREGEVGEYLYADGPPGVTPFVDVRGLF